MARGRRLPISKEEKVALKLSEIVNDYTLDLEEIGRYFYKVAPKVSYNRIIEIVDVAEFEKENANVRHSHYPLF
jgi:protein associated with RNAse G/E